MGKKGLIFCAMMILNFLLTEAVLAQGLPSGLIQSPQFDWELSDNFELLPLSHVLDSARLHSPSLKSADLDLRSQQLAIMDGKLLILKALSLNGSYAYGTNARFNSLESTSNDLSNSLSITESANYSVGIGIKVSLYDILNRKNMIKRSGLEVTKLQYNREILLAAMQELVVTYYHDCLLKKKVLDLYASDKVSAGVNLQMARKQFQLGEITVAEITSVVDSHTNAIINFESARMDLKISLYKLIQLAGISIEDLIINAN